MHKKTTQLEGDDLRQMVMLGDRLDLLLGQLAERDAVFQGQHFARPWRGLESRGRVSLAFNINFLDRGRPGALTCINRSRAWAARAGQAASNSTIENAEETDRYSRLIDINAPFSTFA